MSVCAVALASTISDNGASRRSESDKSVLIACHGMVFAIHGFLLAADVTPDFVEL
jgi:hypothetical protein